MLACGANRFELSALPQKHRSFKIAPNVCEVHLRLLLETTARASLMRIATAKIIRPQLDQRKVNFQANHWKIVRKGRVWKRLKRHPTQSLFFSGKETVHTMKSDFVCHYRVDGVMRYHSRVFRLNFCLSVLSCCRTIEFIGVPSGL